jgi:ABC-type Fe3+-siderophore transport system permease subunit
VLGLAVGALLAGSGAAYQGVFRNPLADPYLLGVAAFCGNQATNSCANDVNFIFGFFHRIEQFLKNNCKYTA